MALTRIKTSNQAGEVTTRVENIVHEQMGNASVYLDTSNNRVGINTASPQVHLDVRGTGYIKDALFTDTLRPYSNTLLTYGSSSTTHYINGQWVGIGTNSANARLDIRGDMYVQDSSSLGYINLRGHIVPDTNEVYDLGTAERKFRDLYLSGNTIQLGESTISSSGGDGGIAVSRVATETLKIGDSIINQTETGKIILPADTKIGDSDAELPQVNLTIAPEVLSIQVTANAAGQDVPWLWTWETSSLPYARRKITNEFQQQVPLYKKGTYQIDNFVGYHTHGGVTQPHEIQLKWVEGAGEDNLITGWVTYGSVNTSHPDINDGQVTQVQRLSVNVPETITPPTLNYPSIEYTLGAANGKYVFSGSASGSSPNIGPFYRGGTYTFNVTVDQHPLYITTDNGSNWAVGAYVGEYLDGVTGSRATGSVATPGVLTFTVPMDAPDLLYYACGLHSTMTGEIEVKDLEVEVNNNGNYVVYAQHDQEGMATPIELRPIPSLVNQMCLVYDQTTNKFVPQDLATYVENTPSFENKIREVAGTAELVVEDGSAVIAKVNVYEDNTYLPLGNNNVGDQAFATDVNTLFVWDGTTWETTKHRKLDEIPDVDVGAPTTGDALTWNGSENKWEATVPFSQAKFDQALAAKSTADVSEDSSNLYYTDTRVRNVLSADNIVNRSYVDSNISAAVTNLVGGAPGALDTLNELAAAINDDESFATTITTSLGQTNTTVATKAAKATTISAGSGLTGGGDLSANRTISHADTSTLTGAINAASGSVLKGVTVDGFGHVTAIQSSDLVARASKLETPRTITLTGEATGSATFDGSGNISIAVDVVGGSAGTATSASNADTLDGLNSTYFLDASNLSTGTLSNDRLSSQVMRTNVNQTISANHDFQGTGLKFSSHYYSNMWAGQHVYQHIYPNGGNGYQSSQWNLRVWDGDSAGPTARVTTFNGGTGRFKVPNELSADYVTSRGTSQNTMNGVLHLQGNHDNKITLKSSDDNHNYILWSRSNNTRAWEVGVVSPPDGTHDVFTFRGKNTSSGGDRDVLKINYTENRIDVDKIQVSNYAILSNMYGITGGDITIHNNTTFFASSGSGYGMRIEKITTGGNFTRIAADDLRFWDWLSGGDSLQINGGLVKITKPLYRFGMSNNDGTGNVFLKVQDVNQWIWNTATNWGVFWATHDTAQYKHFTTTNPNEINFIGNGYLRASIDLDNGNAYFQGEITAASDERLKSDIRPIDNALDIITSIEGKRYIKDGEQSVGVIAQQVEQVLPEVVHTGADEEQLKSVSYNSLVAVLIEAVKEQQKQIEELKEKLNDI